MKLLVTGGAGFIGSHVVDCYVDAGHDVVVVDNLVSDGAERLNPRARLYQVDLQGPELARVFEAERPQIVNHHAAQAEVRRSVEDPELDARVNVLGSVNLLRYCREFGVTRVVYASSGGAVYGDSAVLPTPESHPTRPTSPYGISKLAAEHYLTCWNDLYGIRGLSLRYGNVYGPRQNPFGEAGVVAIFAHRLLQGEPAVINGDGLQTRDYVYVEDVAEANLRALEQPEATGVVNIGTGVETSVVDLYERLRAIAGPGSEARHGPTKPGEQRRSCLDIIAAKRLLDWTPRVTLEEGLQRTMAYFRKRIG